MKLLRMSLITALILVTACGPPTPNAGRIAEPRPANTSMNNPDKNVEHSFTANLPAGFEMPTDNVGKRLLGEYGALFVAQGVAVPRVVVIRDAAAVKSFQASTKTATETIGGIKIDLQETAMRALKEATAESAASGVTITPRGTDAAKRSYEDTVALWASRVEPGLEHWLAEGRLSSSDASRIRKLSPFDQVPEIFELEEQGLYFSKDFSKSIIYSVAPPGTSQHLSMLALDVAEFENPKVREILARHGWFQTVVSDLPHFTYLGVAEGDLPNLGLKKVVNSDREFWVPDQ